MECWWTNFRGKPSPYHSHCLQSFYSPHLFFCSLPSLFHFISCILLFAHSLIARSATWKTECWGTNLSVSSATRQPFRLSADFSSKFRSCKGRNQKFLEYWPYLHLLLIFLILSILCWFISSVFSPRWFFTLSLYNSSISYFAVFIHAFLLFFFYPSFSPTIFLTPLFRCMKGFSFSPERHRECHNRGQCSDLPAVRTPCQLQCPVSELE